MFVDIKLGGALLLYGTAQHMFQHRSADENRSRKVEYL